MAKKIPNKILDATLKDTIFTDQYGVGLNQKVQSLLKQTEDEIVAALAKIDPTSPSMTKWKQARLEKLQEQIAGIVKQGYGGISSLTNSELTSLAKTQAKNVVNKFNAAIGVDLFQATLTPDNVKSIVQNTLVDGSTIKQWWNKQSTDTQRRLSSAMAAGTQALQIGMVQGESVGDLIGRIRGTALTPGVMSVSKREATALVRTSVMQVANNVRGQTYKANADVLDGIEWISTLDGRTTPLCQSMDGKRYDMDLNPIGHDREYPGGPPAHWMCRSTTIPVTKSWSELAGKKETIDVSKNKDVDTSDMPLAMGANWNDLKTKEYRDFLEGMAIKGKEVDIVPQLNELNKFATDASYLSTKNQTVYFSLSGSKFEGMKIGDTFESLGTRSTTLDIERIMEINKKIKGTMFQLEIPEGNVCINAKVFDIEEKMLLPGSRFKVIGEGKGFLRLSLEDDGASYIKSLYSFQKKLYSFAGKEWPELAGTAAAKSPLSKSLLKELDNIPPGMRASMNGPVSGKMTYNDWLKTQSVDTQKEILGPGKWKLWSENKLNVADLVNNNGNPLTIKELQAKLGMDVTTSRAELVRTAEKIKAANESLAAVDKDRIADFIDECFVGE